MGKRKLYSTLGSNKRDEKVWLMMNFISLCDGENSLLEIAERLNVQIWSLYKIVEILVAHDLIKIK